MSHLPFRISPLAAGIFFCCSTLMAQTLNSAVRITEPVNEENLVALPGNTPVAARPQFDRGRVSPDLVMGDLILVLRRDAGRQAAFDRLVASQYDPASPSYHRWLSAEEVGEQFGPAQSDVDAISNWLRGHRFTIDEVSPDRLSIRFSGTASQVENAFHTQIHGLQVKGEQHIANMTDPRIPAALATVVVGVKALHNFFPRPLHQLGSQVTFSRKSGAWERVPSSFGQGDKAVKAHQRVHTDSGTVNGYGNVVEDVAPYDFAKIYNVLPLWQAAAPIDGTGQTIAIAGTSNIVLADVAAFRSAFGLPAKTPTVIITNSDPGTCVSLASSCYGDLIENSLDVEWSGAVAKGASIVLVTSSASTPTTDALYLSENYAVQHKTAPILNVSYGQCELVLGAAGNTQYNNLWQTAAAEGISVFVASGDSGSPSCDQGFDASNGVPYGAQFGLSVSGLTSTPYDTSVGGTDFNWGSTASPYWSTTNSSTNKANALGYVPEVPWNDSCVNPLVLPGLASDAAYLGAPPVTDAESACNFVIYNWSSINQNYGVNLAGLVDTIGGGGGKSACTSSNGGYVSSCTGGYAKPSWQANVTGIPADGKRDVPDVSFFASNGFLGSAYLICVSAGGNACTYSSSSEPTAQEVGGTSVGSPAMAGVMALINQKAGSAQGSPNKTLYALAAGQTYSSCSAGTVTTSSACVFNDINTGTNAMPCQNGSPNCGVLNGGDPAGILTGYSATTGYDLATGLGSLNVANVVNKWPTASAPIVSLSPGSLTFAATVVGKTAPTQAITLKNTGKSALSLSGTGHGISITGTNPTSFSQTNNCGTSLAAAASCSITVTFKPAATGSLSARVSFADNAFGSPQTVTLSGSGSGAAPGASLSASSMTYSTTAIGSTNTAPPISLTNTGSGPLSVTAISITGTNPTSYSQTNNCGTTLAAGASCAITLTFKPTASGTLTAALNVADNATGSPQQVQLSGTGTAVSLSSNFLFFPGTKVGSKATQTVTLTNKGTTAIGLSGTGHGISIAGTNPSSFSQTNTCGTSVAAGASCTITVTFKPVAKGSLTATVNIADSAYGSPQTINLNGTGQ